MNIWRTSNAVARLATLALVFLLTACVAVEPVVKVGLVAPFEGRHREIGYDAIYSARLAVREINAAGGIAGTRVALVALDDGGLTDLAQQTAASLIVDPGVVAVVGHYLPETTRAALPIYQDGGLATIQVGPEPYAPVDPTTLSPAFNTAYEAVTPFDEVAGPYAGPTYAAFQQLWAALAMAEQEGDITDRGAVLDALHALE